MGDFVRDNATAVVGACVALLVSGISVWTAEGGRRRRLLKQVHEALDVLGTMREHGFSPERQTMLSQQLERNLDEYLLTRRERWVRWADRALRTFLGASVLFILGDSIRALSSGEPLTDGTVALLGGFGLGVVGILVITVVAGAVLLAVRLRQRLQLRRLENRVDSVRDRIERLEEREQAH